LNIKGIPYQTVWVEMQDIQTEMPKLGATAPTQRNGRPYYTLPTINDPNTGRIVTDSWAIAEYLEMQYPNTPSLFPAGTRALQAAFVGRRTPAARKLWLLVANQVITGNVLPEKGAEHYRAGVEASLGGATLEQAVPKGADRSQAIDAFIEQLAVIDREIQANGDDALFIGGDAPCFADVHIAAFLTAAQKTLTADSDVWKAFMIAQDGRWARFMQAFEKFQTV
jgi:glutathione S-transferase